MVLSNFSDLAAGFNNVLADVVDSWGDQIITVIGANAPDNMGVRAISTVSYSNGNSCDQYVLYEDGSIYKARLKWVDSGLTWNGDDVYVRSQSCVVTLLNKIGEIEITNTEYTDDESIENVACQLIECLREHK